MFKSIRKWKPATGSAHVTAYAVTCTYTSGVAFLYVVFDRESDAVAYADEYRENMAAHQRPVTVNVTPCTRYMRYAPEVAS